MRPDAEIETVIMITVSPKLVCCVSVLSIPPCISAVELQMFLHIPYSVGCEKTALW